MILNVLSSGSKLKIAAIAPIFYDVAEKFIKQLPPDLPYVFLSTKVPQTNYLIIDAFPSDYHINDRFYYQSTRGSTTFGRLARSHSRAGHGPRP